MSASSAKAGRLFSAAALVLALMVPAGAHAQGAGPLRLFPLPGEMPEAQPEPSDPAREIKEGILAVDDLGAVSPEATGILDVSSGGLPLEMWDGSSRDIVVRALAVMPVDAPSPKRQELARRLLLTTAEPPPGEPRPSLLEIRARKLLQMGATKDLRDLLRGLAPEQMSESLARSRVDSLFVDARLDDACAEADAGVVAYDDPYWLKASVFCSLLRGEKEQASLRLAMLREQGAEDAPFVWAAEQLSGLRVLSLNGMETPTPLTIAMIRATGKPYPAGTLIDADPWLLRAVAVDDKADPGLRVPAAERALLSGAMTAEELAAVYAAVKVDEGTFTKPLGELAASQEPLTGAILYQLAQRQTVPAATAEVVVRALESARQRGVYSAIAALYAPMIERVPVGPEMLWFAEPAARALYAAGRFETARAWFEAAVQSAATDADGAEAADALWPLNRLAFESMSDRWADARMKSWRALMAARTEKDMGAKQPTENAVNRLQARLLSLFQATGDRVTSADWAPLLDDAATDGGMMPAGPRWHAAAQAAEELHLGETVALTLAAMGDAAPTRLADAALYRAVEGLRIVGLDGDARRIAVEAAVEAGI